MYKFNAKKSKEEIIKWIKDWFNDNGKGCNAVVGISGGVDSSVVSALCVEALGKDRVIGVLMPQNTQQKTAYDLINYLGIKYYTLSVEYPVDNIISEMKLNKIEPSQQTLINLPARIRMSTLYAVSQSLNGRVANTCNLSESYVGYDTRWGDSVGDFSPLSKFTKTEVRLIGIELGLLKELIEVAPQDGLCGKTDEDSFGFTYEVLDKYIRTGEIDDLEIKSKIDSMHNKNLFKLSPMPSYSPSNDCLYETDIVGYAD